MTSITKALSKGKKVTLIGFGSFQAVKRPARMYRDIKSGKPFKSKSKEIVKFRASVKFIKG